MQARYFRYLFENTEDVIIQSGCIWDRYIEKKFNYVYVSGACHTGNNKKNCPKWEKFESGATIELLVVGSITIQTLELLVDMIDCYYIQTIVLPYLTPLQRLIISEDLLQQKKDHKKIMNYLQAPYRYLKRKGIKDILLLYRNGETLEPDEWDLQEGKYFQDISQILQDKIDRYEESHVPVVHAGYLIANRWMFYFGSFGNSIASMEAFVQEYIDAKEQEAGRIFYFGSLLKRYRRKFAYEDENTVTMFVTPLDERPEDIDSLLTAKSFREHQKCCADIDEKFNCSLQCIYQNDYALLKRHKIKTKKDSKFGILLTGNVNLKRFKKEFIMRYIPIRDKIRAITLPNDGGEECWDRVLLDLFTGEEVKYMLSHIKETTADKVLRDVITSDINHRLINLSKKNGYCFSGFLMNRID